MKRLGVPYSAMMGRIMHERRPGLEPRWEGPTPSGARPGLGPGVFAPGPGL